MTSGPEFMVSSNPDIAMLTTAVTIFIYLASIAVCLHASAHLADFVSDTTRSAIDHLL